MGGIHHLCDGVRDETTAAVWDRGTAGSLCAALYKREEKEKNNMKVSNVFKKKKKDSHILVAVLSQARSNGTW